MKKSIIKLGILFFCKAAIILAAAPLLALTGCESEQESGTEFVTPADAGTIDGPEGFYVGEQAILTAPDVEYATSYKWYKESTPIAGQTGKTLEVSEEGIYRVAGVNWLGEGKASPAKAMRTLTFTDRLVGEWECKEFWVQFDQATQTDRIYTNDHTVYIERTGDLWENKIAIYNFFEANPPGTYTAFAETIVYNGEILKANGDTVVAIVDEATKTILIPTSWRFTPSWMMDINTELCPMIYDSAWEDNWGEVFPPQYVEDLPDGGFKVELVVGPLVAYIGQEQTPYHYSYMIAETSSTGYFDRLAVAIGTTWTKK